MRISGVCAGISHRLNMLQHALLLPHVEVHFGSAADAQIIGIGVCNVPDFDDVIKFTKL